MLQFTTVSKDDTIKRLLEEAREVDNLYDRGVDISGLHIDPLSHALDLMGVPATGTKVKTGREPPLDFDPADSEFHRDWWYDSWFNHKGTPEEWLDSMRKELQADNLDWEPAPIVPKHEVIGKLLEIAREITDLDPPHMDYPNPDFPAKIVDCVLDLLGCPAGNCRGPCRRWWDEHKGPELDWVKEIVGVKARPGSFVDDKPHILWQDARPIVPLSTS